MALAFLILIILFACSHASHEGSRKNNRVGIVVSTLPTQNQQLNPGGIYNDLLPSENFVIPHAFSANTNISRKSSRLNSRSNRNRIANIDEDHLDDNDYGLRKSAVHIPRVYSSYEPYQYSLPYYPPPPTFYPPPNYFNQPLNIPIQAQTDPNKALERQATIIKEIHHHHYGPESDNRKISARVESSRTIRSSARTQILPNHTNKEQEDVQTYQLNSSTGKLSFMPNSDEQIISVNQERSYLRPQTKNNWVVLYNQEHPNNQNMYS